MKYDWNELEREFLTGNYKSVNQFFKEKGISRNKSSIEKTRSWEQKKHTKNTKKTHRIVEKVIEKQAEIEAEQKVKVNDVAQRLLEKIDIATDELNKYVNKKTRKTKKKFTIKDATGTKVDNEIITEEMKIEEVSSIINKSGLKTLASALKDLSDILKDDDNNSENKTPEIKISVIDNSNLESELWRDFNVNKQ